MSNLTRAEIDAAFEEYRESEKAFNEADDAFVYAAAYRKKAAEEQLDAVMKQAQKDNVIPFPMARCEPKEQPEQSWPEFLFHLMEWPLEIAVVLLAVGFLVVRFGFWLGWFK